MRPTKAGEQATIASHYECHICGITKPVIMMVPGLVTRCKVCHIKRIKQDGKSFVGCKPSIGSMERPLTPRELRSRF